MATPHHRQRRRGPECAHEDCGSRHFYDGDDGFKYCDQGHRQSDLGATTTQDPGELRNTGTKSRRKVEDSDAESLASKGSGYTGSRAFEHYLLCLQLILRKQIRWLVEVQKVSREHETVVRDLWSLRLQKLQLRVSYDSETDTEVRSSQVYSSQSDGDGQTDTGTSISRLSQQAQRQLSRGPNLVELLCLNVLGMQLQRIPITVNDIHGWINDGDLMYYRAGKELPLSMKERLPGEYQQQFEPQILLAPEKLHRRLLDVLLLVHTEFRMLIPPLNHGLVLYRWIRALSLPLEAFAATQRLGRMLQDDFSYAMDKSTRENSLVRSPEVRLMAILVVATKILFPFDGLPQVSDTAHDLGALRLDWDTWVASQDGEKHDPSLEVSLTFEEAFTMSESKSLHMSDQRLDQYLDWYEGSFATDEVRERGKAGRDAEFQRTLFSMFNVETEESHKRSASHAGSQGASEATFTSTTAKLLNVQAAACSNLVNNKQSNGSRIGTAYNRYFTVDTLSGTPKAFHQKAAGLVGLTLELLLIAIAHMERKVIDCNN